MKRLGAALAAWNESSKENREDFLKELKDLMNDKATVIIPVVVDDNVTAQYLDDSDGNIWCGVFTSIDEIPGGADKMLASCPFRDMVETAYRDGDCCGLVFNAWGNRVYLDKEELEFLLRYF